MHILDISISHTPSSSFFSLSHFQSLEYINLKCLNRPMVQCLDIYHLYRPSQLLAYLTLQYLLIQSNSGQM